LSDKQTYLSDKINRKVDEEECNVKQAGCPIKISIEELSKNIDRLLPEPVKRIGRLEDIWIKKGGRADNE